MTSAVQRIRELRSLGPLPRRKVKGRVPQPQAPDAIRLAYWRDLRGMMTRVHAGLMADLKVLHASRVDYDPSQPRGKDGRWVKSGDLSGSATISKHGLQAHTEVEESDASGRPEAMTTYLRNQQGKMVGFVHMKRTPLSDELSEGLGVSQSEAVFRAAMTDLDSEYHGKGLGKAMYEAAADAIGSRGYLMNDVIESTSREAERVWESEDFRSRFPVASSSDFTPHYGGGLRRAHIIRSSKQGRVDALDLGVSHGRFPGQLVRDPASGWCGIVEVNRTVWFPTSEERAAFLRRRAKHRTDAPGAREVIGKAAGELMADWPNERLRRMTDAAGARTSAHQLTQMRRQFKAAIGLDVVGETGGGRELVAGWAEENVALIQSVPQRYFERIEEAVAESFATGERWEQLASRLEDGLRIAESDAARIARDQIGKLYGQLDGYRQRQAGVVRYRWRTVGDNRVREEHHVREGQSFDWSLPPDDGHPGYAINCRCYAEPDLTHLMEE